MSAGDAHGPNQGCGYQSCGNPSSSAPCPFVKDKKPAEQDSLSAKRMHEYRQHWAWDTMTEMIAPFGFFCIYCLEVTEKPIMTPCRENEP